MHTITSTRTKRHILFMAMPSTERNRGEMFTGDGVKTCEQPATRISSHFMFGMDKMRLDDSYRVIVFVRRISGDLNARSGISR
jgi:hypothetical protein